MRRREVFLFMLTVLSLAVTAHIGAETTSAPLAESITFTPPEGWRKSEEGQLPSRVKIMLVGPSTRGFPPSLNLATETYGGTLQDYLKIVKSINQGKGNTWKNLGSITTAAGVGNLSQVDSKTQWGDLRMMHVIMLKGGVVYILTATALREEFPALYDGFFKSFRSLTISKEEVEKVPVSAS